MTVILYHMHILYIYITHNINCHDEIVIFLAKTLGLRLINSKRQWQWQVTVAEMTCAL
jgi:hypothetical protein